jgi:cytochrome c-type biogenesis protein CcmH/NrfG
MEETTTQSKLWSPVQTYALSIICLVLGVTVGYLLHAPAASSAVAPRTAQQMSAVAPGAGQPQITAEQFKHMADKKAELLLAELKNRPDDPALLAEIGRVYSYARELNTSAEYYERSVKIKPDPKVLTALGGVYHHANEDEKAMDAFQRALKADPKYADAMFNIGMLQWQFNSDPKAAIATWQKLLKIHPNHPKREQVEAVIARAKRHENIAPGTKTDKPAF